MSNNDANPFDDIQQNNQTFENETTNNALLNGHSKTKLLKLSEFGNNGSSLILPSRRQFLTTAATATTGLLITPLDGWASFQSGNAVRPISVFKKFGTAITYNLENVFPTRFTGFSNLLNIVIDVIKQVLGFEDSNFNKGCFGDFKANNLFNNVNKLISSVLNERGFNLAGSWLVKIQGAEKRIVKSFQAIMAIADTAKKVLTPVNIQGVSRYFPRPIHFLKAKSEAEEEGFELAYQANVIKSYYEPKFEGVYREIALGTHNKPRVLIENFTTPIFAETEAGALIFTDYKVDSFQNNKGSGKINHFVIPPDRRQEVVNFIGNKYSDFKTSFFNSEQARQDLRTVMQQNSATNEVSTIKFEGQN